MSATLLTSQRRRLGSLEVGRLLPHAHRHMVGPFIFFDHLGPVDLPKGLTREADVRPHPHIGLSTLTYLFAGEIMHRDSTGVVQAIRPGEVNWMTAGAGVTHSERFEQARRDGAPLHAIQTWVALPNGEEERPPAFAHHSGRELPLHQDEGMSMRLLAGEAFGLRSAVKAYSPLYYAHVALQPGARIELPHEYAQHAAYVVSGAVSANENTIAPTQMMVSEGSARMVLQATMPSVLMLLGGESIGPRFIEWNFVSSSRERIEQAKADWRAGRMKLPDADNAEFIPLPPESPPDAGPLS